MYNQPKTYNPVPYKSYNFLNDQSCVTMFSLNLPLVYIFSNTVFFIFRAISSKISYVLISFSMNIAILNIVMNWAHFSNRYYQFYLNLFMPRIPTDKSQIYMCK